MLTNQDRFKITFFILEENDKKNHLQPAANTCISTLFIQYSLPWVILEVFAVNIVHLMAQFAIGSIISKQISSCYGHRTQSLRCSFGLA